MSEGSHVGWAVVPGLGVGPIRFGTREPDITDLLGLARRAEETPEGDRWLGYEGLDLHLDGEEGFRLVSVELTAPSDSTVAGRRWLGAADADWQDMFQVLGVQFRPVRSVEEEQEWESTNGDSSVYSEQWHATAIMLCVTRDDRGEPIWPVEVGSTVPHG